MNLGYHVGDCRDLLKRTVSQTIQCCVTSPPYWGLRDYGTDGQVGLESTPEEYVQKMVDVFRDVRRVLRADGTLWLNLGDSYWNGGGEKRDGGHDFVSGGKPKLQAAKGTVLQRKSSTELGLKIKDMVGIPWRVAFALQADGWYLRSDIIWAKPNPMPESVTDRPTKAHEYLFLLTKSPTYYYDADAIREDAITVGDTRHLRTDRTTESARPDKGSRERTGNPQSEHRNKRTVWTIVTEGTPDAHFATFPTKLVTPCILAGSRVGDIVLDPFGGTGTVGRVAEDLGRSWILFDLSPEYAKIAKRKTAQMGLLGR